MRLACAVTLAVAFVVSGCSDDNSTPTTYVEVAPAIAGQYIVTLRPGVPADAVPGVAATLAGEYGGRVKHRYAGQPGGFQGFAVSGITERRARALALDRRVKSVEQAARTTSSWKRTSPGWALDRIDQRGNALNGAYRYSADGEGVRIYVLDTGVAATHPEFANGVTFGFDATSAGGTGAPCDGHGTAMAGHAAGSTTGVAPAAELVNVKVLDCNPIGGNSTADIIAGVNWVTANAKPPAVVNLSLQLQYGSSSPALRAAVAALLSRDVLVVVAAGNDNDDLGQVEPANYPGVLSVGATLSSGSRWVNSGSPSTGCVTPPGGCGSNFGPALGVFAPGSARTAALGGGYTIAPAGTSSAAAIVSGVAAATLQAFWAPLQPNVVYRSLPSENARRIIIANATAGVVTDNRTSPNRLLFAETWPIELDRFVSSGLGGLTSVGGSASSNGVTPSVAVSGGYRNRFDETPAFSGAPWSAQVLDGGAARWASPHLVASGGCGDVYDANIAHLWVACTRDNAQGLRAVVRAVNVYNGSLVGEVSVGLAAAVAPGQTCAQKHSLARAVRVDSATGAVYVVGEAWCGTGARTAFLAKLDTPATTVLWEKRIFDQGTSSSAAYALSFGSGRVAVAGSQTLNVAGSVPTARVALFSAAGLPLGSGLDLALPGPSAAHAISEDDVSGALYVGATRETANGAVGMVYGLTSGLGKTWEQALSGARVYGIAALKDGVIAAGGTSRFLPIWPVTDPILNAIVGIPTSLRGFLMRFDQAGTLRWNRYVTAGPLVGIGLEGQSELGQSVIAHVVGGQPAPPCPTGSVCLQPPLSSFVASFRVK